MKNKTNLIQLSPKDITAHSLKKNIFEGKILLIKNSKEIFKLLLSLKNKDRVIIYATHNTYFAKMADFKLKISGGKIKSYNERIDTK